MAAVMVVPAEICVKRHGEPGGHFTASGRALQLGPFDELLTQEPVVGAPSWPSMFRPQQNARPLSFNPQV
jgi:hypothetical protein